jgi:hypothetical protein
VGGDSWFSNSRPHMSFPDCSVRKLGLDENC